jgi:hypothetical protein
VGDEMDGKKDEEGQVYKVILAIHEGKSVETNVHSFGVRFSRGVGEEFVACGCLIDLYEYDSHIYKTQYSSSHRHYQHRTSMSSILINAKSIWRKSAHLGHQDTPVSSTKPKAESRRPSEPVTLAIVGCGQRGKVLISS